ncbi:MAG: hypothetical protein MUQ10_02655 [Anaerolineae bacterium]|nr:hypothetical protein [Anaerolineae bacterium]
MTEIELGTGDRGSTAKILRWVIGLAVLVPSLWIPDRSAGSARYSPSLVGWS